jgi:hypothetical protein
MVVTRTTRRGSLRLRTQPQFRWSTVTVVLLDGLHTLAVSAPAPGRVLVNGEGRVRPAATTPRRSGGTGLRSGMNGVVERHGGSERGGPPT